MSCSSFPESALEEATLYSTLQRYLTNIAMSNIDESSKWILSSEFSKKNERVYQLVHELYAVLEIRRISFPVLARLVKLLLNSADENNSLAKLKPILLQSAFRPYGNLLLHKKAETLMFIRHCLVEGAFSITDIADSIHKVLNDCIFETVENSLLIMFFGPEIESYDPVLFGMLSKRIQKHDTPLEPFLDNLDQLRSNKWDLLKELITYSCFKNSIEFYLLSDNVSAISDLTLTEANKKLNNLFFHPRFLHDRNPTLVQFAAFYGSIECFKHLINLGASLKGVEKFAAAGGNMEIIHIVEEKGYSFDMTLKTVTRFRHYDLFEILFNKNSFSAIDADYESLDADAATTIDSVFAKCCKTNNMYSLFYVLKNGASPTKWSVSDKLYLAAEEGHLGVLKLLSSIPGVDYNKIIRGNNPLFAAAENGHLGSFLFLLSQKGVNSNYKKSSKTMLHASAHNGHLDVVKFIIDQKLVDINSVDANNRIPLFSAIEGGYLSVIQIILTTPGLNLNMKDNDGQTALHFAARFAGAEIVKCLVSTNGFNINDVDKQGNTPFHYAASRENSSIAKVLASCQLINFSIRNNKGNTPLHLSAQTLSKAIEFVVTLQGIDVNEKNDNQFTALHLAAKRNRGDSARVLVIAPGIDVNLRTGDGETALLIAAREGFIEVVKALLTAKRIDVNDGNPLYWASKNDWPDIVEVLVECPGIFLDAEGPDHKTPFVVTTNSEIRSFIRKATKPK